VGDICKGCKAQIAKGFNYVPSEGPTPCDTLFVGEAPGATEDKERRPFIGDSGKRLRRTLRELGINWYHLANSVCVRPGEGNPDPAMTWIRQCREVCLAQTIEAVSPNLIVCLGKSALKSFTDNGNIPLLRSRHKTFRYVYGDRAIPVVATWHPAYIERYPEYEDWWEADLEAYVLDNSWEREIMDAPYREVEALTPGARRAASFVVDVETTGLEPWNGDTLRCTGIRPAGSLTNIISHDGGRAALRDLSMDPDALIQGHHLQFDLMWGLEPGELPKCSVMDSLYLHYLLDERYPSRSLDHLSRLYTPYEPVDLPKGGIDHPVEDLLPYNSSDVALTDLVISGIEDELDEVGMQWDKCMALYGRAIPILAGMTRTGIPVDREVLEHAERQEQEKVDRALEHLASVWEAHRPLTPDECDRCEGWGCNIHHEDEPTCTACAGDGYLWYEVPWEVSVLDRPHDLSRFIFQEMGAAIPKMKGARRKDGLGSTKREVLEVVVSNGDDKWGFIAALFAYRDVNENLRKYVLDVKNRIGLDGRVRPKFNIVTRGDLPGKTKKEGTKSGRMSVSQPGLHSTPRGHPMRRAFTPLPGHTHLVQIDRAQAELTDLAQMTRDPALSALINDRTDQHQRMADMATKAGYPMSRQEAKTVNFGILYGIGPPGLEEQTRFDRDAGAKFIDLWFGEYEQVKREQRRIHYEALRQGFVETPYGRRRNFPLGLNPRTSMGGRAERQAFNFWIQSTANDLNVLFLVEWCNRGLEELAFPIFMIHDAVLFSTDRPQETMEMFREAYWSWYADAVEDFMGLPIEVCMRADAKVGPNWGEMVEEDEDGEKLYWFSTYEDEGNIGPIH
jgi:uracil-DNA glycosylase family 4